MNLTEEELIKHRYNCEQWIKTLDCKPNYTSADYFEPESLDSLLTSESSYSPEIKPQSIKIIPYTNFTNTDTVNLSSNLDKSKRHNNRYDGDFFISGIQSDPNSNSSQSWVLQGLRQRGRNWNPDETELFVNIMKEYDVHVSQGYGSLRKSPEFWKKVSTDMTRGGFPRSDMRCKNRWKVLIEKHQRVLKKYRKNTQEQ